MRNTSRSERNQLCVPTHHQTDVCICTYVVMCDIIHLVDYCLLCYQNKRIHRRPNSHQQSAHICHYQSDPTQSVGMQIKCLLTRHINLLPVDHPIIVKPLLLLQGQPIGLPPINSITNLSAVGFSTKLRGIQSS